MKTQHISKYMIVLSLIAVASCAAPKKRDMSLAKDVIPTGSVAVVAADGHPINVRLAELVQSYLPGRTGLTPSAPDKTSRVLRYRTCSLVIKNMELGKGASPVLLPEQKAYADSLFAASETDYLMVLWVETAECASSPTLAVMNDYRITVRGYLCGKNSGILSVIELAGTDSTHAFANANTRAESILDDLAYELSGAMSPPKEVK